MQLVSVNFDIAHRFYRGGCDLAMRMAIFVQRERAGPRLLPACRLQLQRESQKAPGVPRNLHGDWRFN
jgi:hypothetical protein